MSRAGELLRQVDEQGRGKRALKVGAKLAGYGAVGAAAGYAAAHHPLTHQLIYQGKDLAKHIGKKVLNIS